jgi:multiple sugar transport system ATP-binding protein
MATIELRGIRKSFGKTRALDDISFTVNSKEFFCIVGPTNAGKTTTLRIISGLEKQDGGDVLFEGVSVNEVPPRERDVAMLFQNLALYPNKDGFENIATPLRIKNVPDREVKKRVHEVAEILHVTHLLDRMPKTYSGGERQRIAIGRVIIRRPKVYLFDEPLSNLDAVLRAEMRSELKRLQRELGQTTIYVTHDQVEAVSMSDRVLVLNKGEVQQIDTPSRVYGAPQNLFCAGFFGSPPMNFIPCAVAQENGRVDLVSGVLRVDVSALAKPLKGYSGVTLGIRPQHIAVREKDEKDGQNFKVEAVELLGAKKILTFIVGDAIVLAVVPAASGIRAGDTVSIAIDTRKIYIFDEGTKKALV